MCNCNQKRAMYSQANNASPKGMVKVKLTENNPLVLNGDVTGRTYIFRNLNDINWVDNRDVLSMKDINGLQIF